MHCLMRSSIHAAPIYRPRMQVLQSPRRRVMCCARKKVARQQLPATAPQVDVTWQQMPQLLEEGVTVMVQVYDYNRHGLLAQFEGSPFGNIFRGFMPFSQCAEDMNLEDLESMLGQELPAKIARIDDHNTRLVFRSATARVGMQALDITSFKVGNIVEGTVSSIKSFGAFIDIGGFDALLHVNQISKELIQDQISGQVIQDCERTWKNPKGEVMAVGDKLKVRIFQCDVEHGRVLLSTKKPYKKPLMLAHALNSPQASVLWHRIRQMQEEDIVIKVKVDSANKGGLLVTYGPYEGFMPLSQFGQEITVENMEEMVGKELPAKFLEVDEERERLVFSNRRATVNQNFQPAGLKIGDVVVGTVQSLKPYGAFIDIGGVTGLLHVSQVSHERILHLDKIMAEGDKLKVMILSHDNERGRVTLSTKKLEPTPGDMLRNPQLVFEKAEEMADIFRQRVESAQEQINKTVDETGGAEGTPTAAPAQV